MMERIVVFDPEGRVAEASDGESLLSVAARAGVTIDSACGGQGTCGRCRVRILLGDVELESTGPLSAEDLQENYVLACQAKVKTDVVVEVPTTSQLTAFQILENQAALLAEDTEGEQAVAKALAASLTVELPPPTLDSPLSHVARLRQRLTAADEALDGVQLHLTAIRRLPGAIRDGGGRLNVTIGDFDGALQIIDISGAGARSSHYGIAVDVGTTTLVTHLVDLSTGAVVDMAGSHNEQIQYGDDVISRIVWTQQAGENGLQVMRDAVLRAINKLFRDMLERNELSREDVFAVALAGNTVMTHFLLGVDASSIRREPYVPVMRRFPTLCAGEVGLDAHPSAPVFVQPAVAGYVGGDITSGVLATGLAEQTDVSLLIDIGTNGEIVLGNKEWLVTCSCSAGPAFEGVGIQYGMRATRGAIERVTYDPATDRLDLRVIGNTRPRGICGSGLLDLLATLFRGGILERSGRFNTSGPTKRIRDGAEGPEFVLVWGAEMGCEEDITIQEADIENLLRSKAAVFAGTSILVESVGLTPQDIQHIYIAGAFGNYLDIPNAVFVGLLPDVPLERIRFVGNTSVAGARRVLLSEKARRRVHEIARSMTYFELSMDNRFMERYVAGIFLPHTDLSLFPNVAKQLEMSST